VASTTTGRPRAVVTILPFLIALLVFGAVLQHRGSDVTADEPHYLILSWSLLHDHDVDLADNYADRATVQRLYGQPTIDPHAYDYRHDGALISDHQIGLPLLVAPGVAVAGRRGAEIELVLLGALLAQQLFRLLGERRLGRRWMVWGAGVAVVGSLPIVAMAGRVFPDVPAALLVVVAVRLLLRDATRYDRIGASLAIAALPWLHVRYAVIALCLFAGLAYRIVEPRWRWHRRRSQDERGWRWMDVACLAAPIVSVVVMMIAFRAWYGSPWLTAPYRFPPGANEARPVRDASSLYRYGFGQLLSPAFGWFPAAPLHALALVAAGIVAVRHRLVTAWLLILGLLYLGAAATIDPGQNLQARFMVVVIPLVALPLLTAVASRPRWLLVPAAALGAVTLAIGLEAALHPNALAASPNGDVALPIEHQSAWLFPNVSAGPRNTEAAFAAVDLTRQVGRVVTDAAAVNAASAASPTAGDRVVEAGPADGDGYLATGSPITLAAGSYVARFHVAATAGRAGGSAGSVEVAGNNRVVATRDLDGDTGGYVTIALPVRFSRPTKIEWRARPSNGGTVRLAAVDVHPVDAGLARAFGTRFPDAATTGAWVLVGAALVVALVVADRRAPPSARHTAGRAAGAVHGGDDG